MASVAELIVETSASARPPAFHGPTADLVYFLSFAVAERYGSTHELSGVARSLREQERSDVLRPLLTFAEQSTADRDDRRDMEQIWQEAAPVAAAAAFTAHAITGSPRLTQLAGGFPELVPRLKDLAAIAAWAEERQARVRLLFRL